jgi:hypothetical protein
MSVYKAQDASLTPATSQRVPFLTRSGRIRLTSGLRSSRRRSFVTLAPPETAMSPRDLLIATW